jgi:septal ring factor EnvC (AmiA/AmiB activator)
MRIAGIVVIENGTASRHAIHRRCKAMSTRFAWTLIALTVALPAYAQIPPAPAEQQSQSAAKKKCDSLQRHIAKEQKSLASFDETIATDKKGRETCASKPMCTRYDQAIKAMEARKAQHEARLAKFRSDAENACKPS